MEAELSQGKKANATLALLMEDTMHDIRYGFRRLKNRPGFTLTLILTLGLSIGVNISVFSLVNSLLVKGIPYKNVDQLALISRLPLLELRKSPAAFNDWKLESNLLADASLYAVGEVTLLGGPEPQRLQVANVNANFFDLLGVVPRLGRGFLPEEETRGQTNVVVISERLWHSQFGSDNSVIGNNVTLHSEQYTIIGVVPASCDFPSGVDVWTPTAHSTRAWIRSHAVASTVLARMKPGGSIAQVVAQQRAWLQSQHLDQESDRAELDTLAQLLTSRLIGELKRPVLLLLGAVTLVLLIGCANVANLIMADSLARDHEFAIRYAVGMNATRLLRQLITEHIFIGILGGLAGLAMAYWSLPYLKTYLPENWPKFADISIDAGVFGFTVGVSILVGVIVGVVPYWRFAKNLDNITSGLMGRATEPPARRRWREIVVCVETSLAMVLLVASALFIQTLQNLLKTDYGFNPANVLTASVPRENANDQQLNASRTFYSDVLESLRSLPGVETVGGVDYLPIRQDSMIVEEAKAVPAQNDSASVQVGSRVVVPGYFRAMGIPLLEGHDFNEFDIQSNVRVVIIDQTLANKLWQGLNPIGQQISLDSGTVAKIVGVVTPVRTFGPNSDPIADVYWPLAQSSTPPIFSFVLRTNSNPEDFGSQVMSRIRSIDPKQPVDIATMDKYVARSLQRQRGITGMLGILSILGLALAILGVYGLVSYSVASRTREFGIRIALGERPGRIFLRCVSSGMRAVLPGVGLGIIISLATNKILESELFGIRATDALTLSMLAILLTFVAMLAGIFAARRATSVDPIIALREQ